MGSSSKVALIVVAIIAMFQTGVIFYSVGAQSDAAHIIDISGAQRQRTQRLAYFALSLTTAYPAPGAVAAISTTIGDMKRTRLELRRRPQYDSGVRGPDGRTHLGKLADRYIASVLAVVKHPHDPAAILEMERLRPIALDGFDSAVKTRVRIVSLQNTEILLALLVGLLLQIGSIVGVWLRIVAPAEERNRRLLIDVSQAREQIESTFDENPDVIAIYDRDGYLVRQNAARKTLLGSKSLKATKQHYSTFVHPSSMAAVNESFARALAGSADRADVKILSIDKQPIEVSATFFPYLVQGVPSGVTIFSKDIRQMRAVAESNAEQARRLTDLYEIASAAGRTTRELLDSAITLLTARLGYDGGVITEIVDDTVTVVSTTHGLRGLAVGDTRPLATSMVQLAIAAPEVYEDRDFFTSDYAGAAIALNWRSVSGMKIFADGVLYGTVGFSSNEKRAADLSSADVSFMRLACALLGSIIERGRQIKRLDALAFF